MVKAHHPDQQRLDRDAEERRRRGATFRELAHEWLVYLERERAPSHRLSLTTDGWSPNPANHIAAAKDDHLGY